MKEITKLIKETQSEEIEARRLRDNHLDRLHKGLTESIESSGGHLSVVDALLNIDRHITDIASIVHEEIDV